MIVKRCDFHGCEDKDIFQLAPYVVAPSASVYVGDQHFHLNCWLGLAIEVAEEKKSVSLDKEK